MFYVIFAVGLYGVYGSILSCRHSYSVKPLKEWSGKRIGHFLFSSISLSGFIIGDLFMWHSVVNPGIFYAAGFMAIIPRPCNIPLFNKPGWRSLRNLFWVAIGIVYICFLPKVI